MSVQTRSRKCVSQLNQSTVSAADEFQGRLWVLPGGRNKIRDVLISQRQNRRQLSRGAQSTLYGRNCKCLMLHCWLFEIYPLLFHSFVEPDARTCLQFPNSKCVMWTCEDLQGKCNHEDRYSERVNKIL